MLQISSSPSDHNNQLKMITVITLSSFHSIWWGSLPLKFNEKFCRKCHVSFVDTAKRENSDVNPNICSVIVSLMRLQFFSVVFFVRLKLITVFFIKIVFTVRNSVTALLKRNTLSVRTTKFSWQTLKVNQNSYSWSLKENRTDSW